jgi:ABC-type lipoprotein release transport system permease subunit
MDHSKAMKHKNLLFAALADLLRRPVRSVVAILCLAAAIFPIFTALAVSEGVRFQARTSVERGADLYVSQDQYGGNGPVAMASLKDLAALEGVEKATPRVVGRTYFVDRLVSVVGLDRDGLRMLKSLVRGNIPESAGQVLVGQGIAKEFGVKVNLPFTLAANNRKVFKCVGILPYTCLWSSDVLVMHYKDANEFFRIPGHASHFLLYAPRKRPRVVAGTFENRTLPGEPRRARFKVEDRKNALAKLQSGFGWTGGVFTVLWLIGSVMAVLVLLITSGLGLRELQKEMGVMKATGWKRADMMEKVAVEQGVISLTALCLAILVSTAWMKGLNGFLIAQFYVSEVGLAPHATIPFRTVPSHALFCLLFGLCVTQVGGLISVWSNAFSAPGESVR